MNNKSIFAATVALILTGPAFAGGLAEPIIPDPILPPPIVSQPSYAGPFVGITLGYGDATTQEDFGDEFDATERSFDGGFAGVIAGFDSRLGNYVIGADIAYNASDIVSDPAQGIDVSIENFGAIRARAGLLLNDATLIYGAAGYAVANAEFSTVVGDADNASFSGYTAGIGIERQFDNKFGLRGEVNYYDFGAEQVDLNGGFDADPEMTTFSLSVIRRF